MSTPQSVLPATARKELFLLTARALADTHAQEPGDRLAALVGGLVDDEAWVRGLIGWTKDHPALRRFGVAVAAEFVYARAAAHIGSAGESRRLISDALTRADELGELLAYALARHGRSIPKPIKAGVADAAERLYDEHALAVYDTDAAAMRFAEVIALAHPKAVGKQSDVFTYAAQRRRSGSHPVPDSLTALRARADLHAVAAHKRARLLDHSDLFTRAEMPWQQLSDWLGGPMTDKAWAAVLPSMSYRQRLAHLRDFELTGLSPEVADWLCADLAEESSVRRGRAMPVEIMKAARTVPGSRWSWALEQAVKHSLAQVPELSGRTIVLVDRTTQLDDAVVFAAALAVRNSGVELVQFGSAIEPVATGKTVEETVAAFREPGGAHTVAQAVQAQVNKHDRVIVLTHPDAAADAAEAVTVPGHEHIITDANDGWFAAIPAIEMARSSAWPF